MRRLSLSIFSWVRGLAWAPVLLFAACQHPASQVATDGIPPFEAAPAPVVAVTAVNPSVKPGTGPHNAFVLLSGGGTPLSNNYSQYLQAQALSAFFEQRYSAEATWVFFGMGNRDGETPTLADVHQEKKHGDEIVDSWIPGPLHHNHPATRERFLTALREEILPTVRDGGTLFLFVGDHGSLSPGAHPESVITLWQLQGGESDDRGWMTSENEVLSVTDLRNALASGLGQGRVVFCMTQCHSGGFQYLGVPREVAAPAEWFTGAHPSLPPPVAMLPIAGFTATDEESLAAGCDPDPDPDKWAGYERFLPEHLLGEDLFTRQPSGSAMGSFAEAHAAAVLVDRTIDLPRSSSEQYLETWAQALERLAASPGNLTEKSAAAVRAFQRAVQTGRMNSPDPMVRAKAVEFGHFTSRLIEQNPATKELLLAGTRSQLEEAIRGTPRRRGGSPGGRRSRGATDPVRRAWREVVRPAWKAAVLENQATVVPAGARDFERYLLAREDRGRDFFFSAGGDGPMLNEIYWRSGYAFPATLDRAKAEAVAQWGVERANAIIAWAKKSPDEKVRAAGETLGRQRTPAGPEPEGDRATSPVSRKTAAQRVLFYRRTLAAWECLVAMDNQPALAQLAALIDLERTPLPPAR